MGDGIFTQPGPDGIFNGGNGPSGDASNPTIDSSGNAFDFGLNDAQSLRETLLVAYPSPGHMRVARAIVNAETNELKEYQEQFREPSPEEVEWLRRKGVTVGPGSIVKSQSGGGGGGPPQGGGGIAPGVGDAGNPPNGTAATNLPAQPKSGMGLLGIGLAFAAGAAALWAGNKYVLPKLGEMFGGAVRENPDDDDGDDGEYEDED